MANNKKYTSSYIQILIVILLVTLFNYANGERDNKKKFDTLIMSHMNIHDDSPRNCSKLFNKIEDFDKCLKVNNDTAIENHYFFFHIVSKLEGLYYEFHFGLCLKDDYDTVKSYIDEDYLMVISNGIIENSQILRIKEIRQVENYSIAAKCVIVIIVLYCIFCMIVWYYPSQSALIEKNDVVLKHIATTYEKLSPNLQILDKVKEIKPDIENTNIVDRLLNSFSMQSLFSEVITSDPKYKLMKKEIRILIGIKAICYYLVMLYTCAPILFKPSSSNPEFLYNQVKSLFFQFIFNGDMFFDIIIAIEGFLIVYGYLHMKAQFTFKTIIVDFIGKVLESYFCMIVIYFIFWKVLPVHSPLSNLLYEYERESCQAQVFSIFGLFSNFTFGQFETSYPYCVYHYWFIHLLIQYFIVAMAIIMLYKWKPSLFYLLFFLLFLNVLFLQLWKSSNDIFVQSFYEVLRTNPANVHLDSQKKFFSRLLPLLIGVFMAIIYKNKDNNFIGNIQSSQCKSFLLFLVGTSIFFFWFLMHFFIVNQYAFISDLLLFCYKIFKRAVFPISFFMMFIPLLSKCCFFTLLCKLFTNSVIDFLSRISLGVYLAGAIIARVIFYNQMKVIPSNTSDPFELTLQDLLYSFIAIGGVGGVCSVIITALFKVPFMRVWLILKRNNVKTIK